MDIFNFEMYIRTDAFILIPVLYVIGLLLRQTPYLPKWSYAWIQMLFAVISCLLYYGLEIQSVVQGILVTGVAMISTDVLHNTIDGITESKNKLKRRSNKKPKKRKKKTVLNKSG